MDEYDKIRNMMGKDYYLIETDDDGSRYVHVEECLWNAHQADRTVIVNGTEVDADIVVTEFTWCYIPLEDFLEAEDRRELVSEYQGEVQQYEGEYTFDMFIDQFYPKDAKGLITAGSCYSAKYLDYDDIKEDTPDGWYCSKY